MHSATTERANKQAESARHDFLLALTLRTPQPPDALIPDARHGQPNGGPNVVAIAAAGHETQQARLRPEKTNQEATPVQSPNKAASHLPLPAPHRRV